MGKHSSGPEHIFLSSPPSNHNRSGTDLEEGPVTSPRTQPLPHQKESQATICPGLGTLHTPWPWLTFRRTFCLIKLELPYNCLHAFIPNDLRGFLKYQCSKHTVNLPSSPSLHNTIFIENETSRTHFCSKYWLKSLRKLRIISSDIGGSSIPPVIVDRLHSGPPSLFSERFL
jgi:hypothetical protein